MSQQHHCSLSEIKNHTFISTHSVLKTTRLLHVICSVYCIHAQDFVWFVSDKAVKVLVFNSYTMCKHDIKHGN